MSMDHGAGNWLDLAGYSGMQANQAHPRPQTLDPVLTQMY